MGFRNRCNETGRRPINDGSGKLVDNALTWFEGLTERVKFYFSGGEGQPFKSAMSDSGEESDSEEESKLRFFALPSFTHSQNVCLLHPYKHV